MPLHDNLERKRRQKIGPLLESGACHLCECITGSRSYRRFVGNDGACDDVYDDIGESDMHQEETIEKPMRTCMCHPGKGQIPTSWPFPLKVCEQCISDDLSTGRVRCCGICGVVACDEKCGIELAEVTDKDSWNNAGCLECRGMESFSEMELFRRKGTNGKPRVTRICTACLELFSLFSYGNKYHFKCRYFKCNNILVPSDIVELKRDMKPFPLGMLPEELLVNIVDFLGGKDMYACARSCTTMFRKVEKVSMDVVLNSNHQLPTGPVQHVTSNRNNVKKTSLYAEGRNRHGLRPPEDATTWVGVLNQMEQLASSIFYFDFQVKSGDHGAAGRYLRNRNKLVFAGVYSRPTGGAPDRTVLIPYGGDGQDLQVRGGQALVTRFGWRHSFLDDREERTSGWSIFSTNRVLTSGVHRVIIRFYCFCVSETLGSVGILRRQGDGTRWAAEKSFSPAGRMEEQVFGMEYDADQRRLLVYKKNERTNKMELPTPGWTLTVDDERGDLCFAASLASGSSGIKGNQLSIRACTASEWTAFLDHTPERNIVPGIRGRGRRGEERFMRYLDHRTRRALAGRGNDGAIPHQELERIIGEHHVLR